MGELYLAQQMGEKITNHRTYRGFRHVCTTCLALSRKLRLLRHKKGCPNRGCQTHRAAVPMAIQKKPRKFKNLPVPMAKKPKPVPMARKSRSQNYYMDL